MTDENAPTKADISKQDRLLRNLVLLANSEIMSISITLTVNGIVLAGRLIGYKQYYDGIIKSLSSAKVITSASEETTTKSKDAIVEFFEEIKDIATKEKSDELIFMHLEKAVVLNDSCGNLLHPNYWRLKIDSVDGFMIGALEKYA